MRKDIAGRKTRWVAPWGSGFVIAVLLAGASAAAAEKENAKKAQPAPKAPPAAEKKAAPPAPVSIEFRVQVILAKRTQKFMDPKLKTLDRQLRNFNFSSFELLADNKLTVKIGEKGRVALPSEVAGEMELEPTLLQAPFIRVKISIPEKLHTVVRLRDKATFIIANLPPPKDGKVFVALKAAVQ